MRLVTQQALATAIGRKQAYVSDLKTGRANNPTLDVIEGIAMAFGLEPADMLTDQSSHVQEESRVLIPPEHRAMHKKLQHILETVDELDLQLFEAFVDAYIKRINDKY